MIGYLGTGSVNISGGADVTVAGETRIAEFGPTIGNLSITGNGSTWTNTGAVNFGKGSGTITVANGATLSASSISLGFNPVTLTGNGDVTAPVTSNFGTVAPGAALGTLHITGAYTQGAHGKLQIELGGTAAGSQYDRLWVTGAMTLSGTLQVTLSSFSPAQNDVFDILDFTSVAGAFSTVSLPALSGSLEWDTSKLYVDGTIRVVLPGDFNNGGAVDTADYVGWRKGLDTTYVASDYNLWRTRFGRSSSGGAAALESAAIPEPLTAQLLCAAGLLVMCNRRTFGRRS
jgi:T5SS/PEP-CTERM-associated repeat protein